jgi:hypothetical protein
VSGTNGTQPVPRFVRGAGATSGALTSCAQGNFRRPEFFGSQNFGCQRRFPRRRIFFERARAGRIAWVRGPIGFPPWPLPVFQLPGPRQPHSAARAADQLAAPDLHTPGHNCSAPPRSAAERGGDHEVGNRELQDDPAGLYAARACILPADRGDRAVSAKLRQSWQLPVARDPLGTAATLPDRRTTWRQTVNMDS